MRAFFGVVSQWTAAVTSPSNSSTHFSNRFEIRSNLSDSSGASLPAVLRRARVRSGMPMIDASKETAKPLLNSKVCKVAKEKPRETSRARPQACHLRGPPGTIRNTIHRIVMDTHPGTRRRLRNHRRGAGITSSILFTYGGLVPLVLSVAAANRVEQFL